jgi:hypothetical protein
MSKPATSGQSVVVNHMMHPRPDGQVSVSALALGATCFEAAAPVHLWVWPQHHAAVGRVHHSTLYGNNDQV